MSKKDELAGRRNAMGEHRLPPAIAVILAIAAYAALPESLLIGHRYVIPVIELVLLVALIATNPTRITRETQWSRAASIVLSSLVIVTNLVALGMLVDAMTHKGTPAGPLLVAAGQVWITGVIGFGLLFWEIDRGGPVARRVTTHDNMQPADWRFSQDENHDTVAEVAVILDEMPDVAGLLHRVAEVADEAAVDDGVADLGAVDDGRNLARAEQGQVGGQQPGDVGFVEVLEQMRGHQCVVAGGSCGRELVTGPCPQPQLAAMGDGCGVVIDTLGVGGGALPCGVDPEGLGASDVLGE